MHGVAGAEVADLVELFEEIKGRFAIININRSVLRFVEIGIDVAV